MAAPEQTAHVFEDMTLSFSDEEWLELASWQRDLYRTVMKDTMELVTSLGYIFLKSESMETAHQDAIPVPETAVTLEKGRLYSEPFTFPHTEISAPPVAPPGSKTTVIQKQLEHFFPGAQKTLGERPDPPNTETPERKDAPFTTRPKDAPNPPCSSGPVLDGSCVDLMEGDRLPARDLFPDSEFLTVLKVEEIAVAIGSEVSMSPHREDRQDRQGGAGYPLALTSPNTMLSYSRWSESHGVLSPGTLQWTEEVPSGSGQRVEDGDDRRMSTQESLCPENLYKCSMCSRSFSQSPYLDHHGRVEERTPPCPTCYPNLITDPPEHLLHRHQKTHSRNKTPAKGTAPAQRKVYGGPNAPEPRDISSAEAYSKLHRHLQLSSTFLQQLLTSTCGFQYD